jgi:DNA polymerase III sliding clamp (beta) subunit (PCNA family)
MKIKTSILKAVSVFIATKDVRYYLKGLHINKTGNMVRVTASDGYSLATAVVVDDDDLSDFDFVVDPSVLPLTSKAEFLEFDKIDGGILLSDPLNQTSRTFQPMEGRYPDCSKVWPKKEEFDRNMATFNPELIARLSKVNKILKIEDFSFWYTSTGLVFRCGPVRGIIMGMRAAAGKLGDMAEW